MLDLAANLTRFMRFVDVQPTGCWLWTGYVDRKGYGQFRLPGRAVWAHRFAYEAMIGELPDGMTVGHMCCCPSCVNPDHLEPQTRSENTAEGNRRRRIRLQEPRSLFGTASNATTTASEADW